jgi:hypothetical protein
VEFQERRKETAMKKDIKVDRVNKKTDSPNKRVATGDDVDWKISSIGTNERLVLNSSLINATGTVGSDTLTVTIPVVGVPYTLNYGIGVQTVPPLPALPSSPVPVASDKLVIDTIGPPTPPKYCPEDEDERGRGDRQRKNRD